MNVGNKFIKNFCKPKFTSTPNLISSNCSSISCFIFSKLKLLASLIVITSVLSPLSIGTVTETSIRSFLKHHQK